MIDISHLSKSALNAAATAIGKDSENFRPRPDGEGCPSCEAQTAPVARELLWLADQLRDAANR